jgi:hypothetical protein
VKLTSPVLSFCITAHRTLRMITRGAVSSFPVEMDPPDLKSFLMLQEEALKSLLQSRHPAEDVAGLLDQHTEKVFNIAECYSSKSLTSGTRSTSGTASVPISPGVTAGSASAPGTPSTAFRDDTISVSSIIFPESNAISNSAAPVAGCGLNAYSVPLDNFPSDSHSFTNPVADTMMVYNSPILRDLTNIARSRRSPVTAPNRREESWTVKTEPGGENSNRPRFATPIVRQEEQRRVSKTLSQEAQNEQILSKNSKASRKEVKNKSMFISDSDSSEEEFWIFEAGDRSGELNARRRARRIIQEPKVKKAGQARRKSTASASDAAEMKILLDLGAWEEDELIRKRGIGALDPVQMYDDMKELIPSDGNKDEDSNSTASQVALMLLSLGSTEAIVDLKDIIKDMRCISQTKVVRPPIKVDGDLPRFLELVRRAFVSKNEGTSLEIFQSRYWISNFCQYMIRKRNELMRQERGRGMKVKDAERRTYASLIARAYPKIQRYEKGRAGAKRKETSEFKVAVLQLQTKCKRGYRWLKLRKIFGIGIMALYYHSKLFSETAHVSIDDDDMSGLEFNLLKNYLLGKGSAHTAWLHRLCSLINDHIQQGAEGILVLPELLLERWEVKQIMACQEQSDWLAMMCETLEHRLSCPGNKLSEAAWFSVDRHTILSIWQKDVEKDVYKEVQEEAQEEAQL